MKKIPTLFQRHYDFEGGDNQVYNKITPGCEWVIEGLGIPTEKFDGTACMIQDGKLWKRYSGRISKPIPPGFIQVDNTELADRTGKMIKKVFGWVPVDEHAPGDQYHRETWSKQSECLPGTYELVGPKIQGNPYRWTQHLLIPHNGSAAQGIGYLGNPRNFEEIRMFLKKNKAEGIVWWRDIDNLECDKVKIKRRDFGLEWPVKVDPLDIEKRKGQCQGQVGGNNDI